MLHWLGIAIFGAAALGLVIAGAMFIWTIKLVDPAPHRSEAWLGGRGPRSRRRRERADWRDHVISGAVVGSSVS